MWVFRGKFWFFKQKRETICKYFDSKYEDYRDFNRKKAEYINNKLNMGAIHEWLSKLDLNSTQLDSVASSLYPSAMWDESSVNPKIETGYAFKPHMKDFYVEAFNNQTFNGDGNDSTRLKINYYNPPNLIFQLLLVK